MKTRFTLILVIALILVTVFNSNAQHRPFKSKRPFQFDRHRDHRPGTPPRTRGTISKPKNQKNFTWRDTVGGTWENNLDGAGVLIHEYDQIFTYDSNGNITEDMETDTMGGKQYRTQYSYDTKGNVIMTVWQSWEVNKWENYEQYIYTYDVENNLTKSLFQEWNGNNWDNYDQELYTFDAKGNMTQYLYQEWNSTKWVTYYGAKDIYTYDANNHITSDIYQENEGGGFVNAFKYIYVVTPGGEWTEMTEQEWDGTKWINTYHYYNATWKDFKKDQPIGAIEQSYSTGSWVDTLKYSFTYDSFGGQVAIIQEKSGSNWVNDFRYSEIYDSHYNYIGYTDEIWNAGYWEINDQENHILTYNGNDEMTRMIYQTWNSSLQALVNWERKDFSDFQSFDITGIEKIKFAEEVSIYPIPASDNINVAIKNNTFSVASVNIFNSLGEKVVEITSSTASSINAIQISQLPQGIYFVRLTGKDHETVTSRFIKQ